MEDLQGLLEKAKAENEKLLRDYGNYPPIHNSKGMLAQISGYIDLSVHDLSDQNLNEINVGLLAAKSLDFDSNFSQYAMTLYKVWSSFLIFQHRPFSVPIRGAKRVAYQFYKSHGFSDPEIIGHFAGIDFSKSVSVINLSIGKRLAQWKAVKMPQGNYYGELNKNPSCLGIHDKQEDFSGNIYKRIEYCYEVSQSTKIQTGVDVLETIANKVIDTWSIKNCKYPTSGGCLQYFNSNDKQHLKKIYP